MYNNENISDALKMRKCFCCWIYIFLYDVCLFSFRLAHMEIAMQDPCRPGVKDAVMLCQNAGVKVLFNYSWTILFKKINTSLKLEKVQRRTEDQESIYPNVISMRSWNRLLVRIIFLLLLSEFRLRVSYLNFLSFEMSKCTLLSWANELNRPF